MKNFFLKATVAVVLIGGMPLFKSSAVPYKIDCISSIKSKKILDEDKIKELVKRLPSDDRALWNQYQTFYRTKRTDEIPPSEVIDLLSDDDLTTYKERFKKLLASLKKDKELSLRQAIEAQLVRYGFTHLEIANRIGQLKQAEEGSIFRVLGDRTLEEVRVYFYGDNLQKISKNSLIGRYIAKTGAKTKLFRHNFRYADQPRKGPEKLLIAVSKDSFNEFQEILSDEHFMTVVGHANVIHRGKIFMVGGQVNSIRAPSEGTPLPLLMLKSSEAERMSRYLNETPLYNGWSNKLKQPWLIEGYCAEGGFRCCTHWIGNIPIGDKRVDKYSFPGGDGFRTRRSRGITQKLEAYIPKDKEEQRLAKIWKVPGHEQLSDAIGVHEANVNGEMASPGWVIQTLLGATSQLRVPIVFLMTENHKKPIGRVKLEFEDPF
jgi:hypothetical protein